MREGGRRRVTILAGLRKALDAKEWRSVKQHLQSIATSIPRQASGADLAACLELVRGAASVLAEASSFTTAFETAYETRRGLHRAGTANWACNVLKGFAAVGSVVSAVSAVLGMLGMNVEGRALVGKCGAVDELTMLWHRYPDCVQIVSALVALCPGHIDNVSRVMRRRGLVVAMDVLENPESFANPELVGQTLILIGMCSICTPDNEEEGKRLVPTLLDALERLNDEENVELAQHAILAVANVGDCWLKESAGYEIADPRRLCTAIKKTWEQKKLSTELATAVSRALLSLWAGHPDLKVAVLEHSDAIVALAAGTMHCSTTTNSLHEAVAPSATSPKAAPASRQGLRSNLLATGDAPVSDRESELGSDTLTPTGSFDTTPPKLDLETLPHKGRRSRQGNPTCASPCDAQVQTDAASLEAVTLTPKPKGRKKRRSRTDRAEGQTSSAVEASIDSKAENPGDPNVTNSPGQTSPVPSRRMSSRQGPGGKASPGTSEHEYQLRTPNSRKRSWKSTLATVPAAFSPKSTASRRLMDTNEVTESRNESGPVEVIDLLSSSEDEQQPVKRRTRRGRKRIHEDLSEKLLETSPVTPGKNMQAERRTKRLRRVADAGK